MLALKNMKMGRRPHVHRGRDPSAGDEDGACKAFESAIEPDPDHVDARRRIRLRDVRQSRHIRKEPGSFARDSSRSAARAHLGTTAVPDVLVTVGAAGVVPLEPAR